MKTPLEAAINPQKKKTVTRVVNAELLFFALIKVIVVWLEFYRFDSLQNKEFLD